jgi:hypothetical protein
MKFEQSPKFQPITIVLETNEEAMALWNIVEDSYVNYDFDSPERMLAMALSNHFSLDAQLGGKNEV